MVALIICLPGHFSSWNIIIKLNVMQLSMYTFNIEISTGPEINEDLHDGVGISLGTPVGGLNAIKTYLHAKNAVYQQGMDCRYKLTYCTLQKWLVRRDEQKLE